MTFKELVIKSVPELYCIGGNSGDHPTSISRQDISYILREFLDDDEESTDDKFGAKSITSTFIALCPKAIAENLNKVSGFISVHEYPTQAKVFEGEVGCMGSFHFIETNSPDLISNDKSLHGKEMYRILCVEVGKKSYDGIFRVINLHATVSQGEKI